MFLAVYQVEEIEHLYNETSYHTDMYYFILFFRYPVISFLVYLKQMVRFVLFYFCPKTNTLVKPYRIFNYDLFNEFQHFWSLYLFISLAFEEISSAGLLEVRSVVIMFLDYTDNTEAPTIRDFSTRYINL